MKELADRLPTCPMDLDDPSHGFKRISWEGRLFVDESGAGAVATDLWSGAKAPLGIGEFVAEFVDEDALIMQIGTEIEIEPGTLLSTDIVQGYEDELFIASVDKKGLVPIKESCDDKMAAHEIGKAEFQTGHCRSVLCADSHFQRSKARAQQSLLVNEGYLRCVAVDCIYWGSIDMDFQPEAHVDKQDQGLVSV